MHNQIWHARHKTPLPIPSSDGWIFIYLFLLELDLRSSIFDINKNAFIIEWLYIEINEGVEIITLQQASFDISKFQNETEA